MAKRLFEIFCRHLPLQSMKWETVLPQICVAGREISHAEGRQLISSQARAVEEPLCSRPYRTGSSARIRPQGHSTRLTHPESMKFRIAPSSSPEAYEPTARSPCRSSTRDSLATSSVSSQATVMELKRRKYSAVATW